MSGWTILGIIVLIGIAAGLIVLWIGGAFHDIEIRRRARAAGERDVVVTISADTTAFVESVREASRHIVEFDRRLADVRAAKELDMVIAELDAALAELRS